MPRLFNTKEHIVASRSNTKPCIGSNNTRLRILAANLRKQFAKDVLFTDDYIVSKAMGDFKIGDSVKNLSLTEILIKLLALTKDEVASPDDVPEIPPAVENSAIVETILQEKVPLYQIDNNFELIMVDYTYKTFDSATYAEEPKPLDTAFYQKLNLSGNVVESGYQHCTEMQDMYYLVMLPEELVVGKNVKIQTWSALEGCWKDLNSPLTCDYEEISAAFNEVGLEAPSVADGYTLWADLSSTDPGTNYRYIIL